MTQAPARSALAGAAELTPGEFARLAAIAREDAGISLAESKKQMVQSRLTRHMKRTGFTSYDAYIRSVEDDKHGPERERLINLLTTNVSSFFREGHHFETLATKVFPELIGAARKGQRVRIWSAGCSTGQEPYSIAMQALTMADDLVRHDFRILATDIDRDVLQTALTAQYPEREVENMQANFRQAFIRKSNIPEKVEIAQPVRDLVTFRRLNLNSDWPMKHPFDVIFCRNVVIYFDDAVQGALWPRFLNALKPDGWLFLGHSERLNAAVAPQFEGAGITTFRKRQKTKGAA